MRIFVLSTITIDYLNLNRLDRTANTFASVSVSTIFLKSQKRKLETTVVHFSKILQKVSSITVVTHYCLTNQSIFFRTVRDSLNILLVYVNFE